MHLIVFSCLVSSGTSPNSPSGKPVATNSQQQQADSLLELISRHVRAILGQDFWSRPQDEAQEHSTRRPLTLLELLITVTFLQRRSFQVTLHFLRSYYLNSPTAPVSESDIVTSWRCKMAALDFLREVLEELTLMMEEV